MVEVSLTVGKLDASLALLLTKDHHLIEFPTILLPNGVKAGSIVTIKCERDLTLEKEENENFSNIQQEILNTFGTNSPQAPVLKNKNTTQTSCVLEWEPLQIGTSSIKSLTLYKDGVRLGQIPNPLVNTTTKLSGLPIDKPFTFHLRLDTTAGVFESEKLKVTTHKMTDLSGITVCLGEIDPNDEFDDKDIEDCLLKIGAKPLQRQVKVDTTHFVTTNKNGDQYKRATDNNIPVVRPEWLKTCELERRIVGVRQFYLDEKADLPRKHYWRKDIPTSAATIESKSSIESSFKEAGKDNIESIGVKSSTEEIAIPAESPEAEVQVENLATEAKAADTFDEVNINDSTIIPEEPDNTAEVPEALEPSIAESAVIESEISVPEISQAEIAPEDSSIPTTEIKEEQEEIEEPKGDVIKQEIQDVEPPVDDNGVPSIIAKEIDEKVPEETPEVEGEEEEVEDEEETEEPGIETAATTSKSKKKKNNKKKNKK